MNELREVKIGKTFSEIKNLAIRHFQKREVQIPSGFTSGEFNELRNSFIRELSVYLNKDISGKPLIVTGHQPEFHHPGILWKDFLACRIASDVDGVALHISVDTDEFEIGLSYPVLFSPDEAAKKHFVIPSDKYGIFLNSRLTSDDRKKLKTHIKEANENAVNFLIGDSLALAQKSLLEIENSIDASGDISGFLEKQRVGFLNEMGVSIRSIPVSFLASLPAFKLFSGKVSERLPVFIEAFNRSLHEYRVLHKIKNPAQPLPEIREGDMPFWVLDKDSGKRLHVPQNAFDDQLIPRAITLTMFIRIFLADFFIHGTGGGRYEAISDNVLLQFFGTGFCDYTISTATMNLTPKEKFPLDFPDEKEIENAIRDLKHSPEKFLPSGHPLALEKRELLIKFKDPAFSKKDLHVQLTCLNEKMSNLLTQEKIRWEKEKLNFPKNHHAAEVFHSRDFPYFYYNVRELYEYSGKLG